MENNCTIQQYIRICVYGHAIRHRLVADEGTSTREERGEWTLVAINIQGTYDTVVGRREDSLL